MRLYLAALLLLLVPACEPIEMGQVGSTTSRSAAVAREESPPPPSPSPSSVVETTAVIPIPWSPLTDKEAKVAVYPKGSEPNKHALVVGVLDLHTSAGNQDKGFDILRKQASQLGADAVIGAEFEHGDGSEPSHLSGMAVRFIDESVTPYAVLGTIDIATPEDADDKGYEAMRTRAVSMGADEVINVQFVHGAEGGESHLIGVAIRHTER